MINNSKLASLEGVAESVLMAAADAIAPIVQKVADAVTETPEQHKRRLYEEYRKYQAALGIEVPPYGAGRGSMPSGVTLYQAGGFACAYVHGTAGSERVGM